MINHVDNDEPQYQLQQIQKWGYPNSRLVYFMENPLKWMMTRGTPISGNLHVSLLASKFQFPPSEIIFSMMFPQTKPIFLFLSPKNAILTYKPSSET